MLRSIIEDFELNIAYSLSVEPSGCGVGPWAVWSKMGLLQQHHNPITTRLYTQAISNV